MANFVRKCCLLLIGLLWLPSVIAASATQLEFLALADIHFDPIIGCYRESRQPCPLLQQLRQAPVKQWRSLLQAQATPSHYRQDTNISLLQTSLAEAKSAAKEVAFVVVLGDTLPHDFRRYYKKYSKDHSRQGFHDFALKTLAFMSDELEAAFPNTSVFMVVGNNDTYSGNYQSVPRGEFFAKAAADWSLLIKNKADRSRMLQQFPLAGYYAVDVPGNEAIRLVVVNSSLFSKRSRNTDAALAAKWQLQWLQRELKQAQLRQQKVLIALHIPPMVDMYLLNRWHLFSISDFWQQDFLNQFKEVLQPYDDEIVAMITGHLHYGWSQWLKLADGKQIPIVSVPSISPIFGNNPTFKVFELTSQGGLQEKRSYRIKLERRLG